MRPLAELIIEEAVDVVVPVAGFLAPSCLEESSVVVGVVEQFAVRVGHFLHASEGVEDVDCQRTKKLDRRNQELSSFQIALKKICAVRINVPEPSRITE
jgi:hypothetical protein